ncbi:MAG: T9SS type A sorting domain-containing protein [Bacteroidota bacterium]|nr:T9SS type A sorting domain-containing protein [Bacteroidota bacterium]
MAQGNLVPNSSFEANSGCPNSNGQFYLVNDWNNPTSGTPDYFDTCNPFTNDFGVPNNVYGEQVAHYGGAYCLVPVYFGTYMEYIQTQLHEPMQTGETYCVDFYVCLTGNSDFASVGPQIYFSNSAVSSSTFLRLPYAPHIFDTILIYDTTSWTHITEEYVAQGGEHYLTIGNFFDELNTPHDSINNTTTGGSFFFIDDVSVYKKMRGDAGNNKVICLSDSTQLGSFVADSGIVYSWTPSNSLNDSTSHDPWVKPLQTTTYYLTIADTGNLYCSGSPVDSVTITVNDCTPLPRFLVPTILKSDELFYISALPENTTLALYDARGRLIMKKENYRNDYSVINLVAGIYVYKLSLPDGTPQSGKICIIK